MKNSSHITFVVLTILVVLASFFGQVTKSHAQENEDWTQPVNLSSSGLATDPVLLLDTTGVLHALWRDGAEADGYKYSQSIDNGLTWSVPHTAAVPFGKRDSIPMLMETANGSIHIFWISGDELLFYARTVPQDLADSAKWQLTKILAGRVSTYDVIKDIQGTLHLAYIQNAAYGDDLAGAYYRQSPSGAGAWSQAVELYTSEYFRSAKPASTSIHIAAAGTAPDQSVYVTWDIRPQRRVFMTSSNDAGLAWGTALEIKGPKDTGNTDSPFNLNIAAIGNNVLLLWQVGEPGYDRCSVFSQWSQDHGETWGDVLSVLKARTNCPESSNFVFQDEDHIVARFISQGDPTFVAWNGEQWSDPQAQIQLPFLANPVTFESIFLSCRSDVVYQDQLYVVGCDEGGGGDVWFLSRTLDPVQNWFSPSQAWSAPLVVEGESDSISAISAVADAEGTIHSIWIRSSSTTGGSQRIGMQYGRWTEEKWTGPESVISSLQAIPQQTSLAIDNQKRLLLSWVDEHNGELLFSWADLARANLGSEWQAPVRIPSPSHLISPPDIVVDGSGEIVVAYAVPFNEERGIYIVKSTDGGKSWSPPTRVFDAISAHWDKIGSPKISLSQDGMLHVIFSRISIRPGQPVGLYYTRSSDGGLTWMGPQLLSEGDIQWSDIVSYDDRIIHILWQEYDGLVFANLSQVSTDGGVSWGQPLDITGVNAEPTLVSLASDGAGNLHFVQLLEALDTFTIQQDNLILQDWKWDGSAWGFGSERDVIVKGHGLHYSLAANATSRGYLVISLAAEYSDAENEIHNEIQTFSRYLGESDPGSHPAAGFIPTPAVAPVAIQASTASPTQSADLSILYDDNISTTSTQKTMVGILIIVVGIAVSAFVLMRRRSGPAKR